LPRAEEDLANLRRLDYGSTGLRAPARVAGRRAVPYGEGGIGK